MTPFRQLLRQPIRLIAVLLLLGMSATFFCLSGGVFVSAQTTLDEVERNYITKAPSVMKCGNIWTLFPQINLSCAVRTTRNSSVHTVHP